jgi:hypothetical protein
MWELIDAFIAEGKRFSVLDVLLLSLERLRVRTREKLSPRVRLIAKHATQNAPPDSHIHETLAHTYLFHFLRTGDPESEKFIARLIADCDSQRAAGAIGPQLHTCREGGWLTAGNAIEPDALADAVRARTWGFFGNLLTAAQMKLQRHRDTWRRLHKDSDPDAETVKPVGEKLDRVTRLVDAIAMQLYFASGAHNEKNEKGEQRLTPAQLERFWREAAPLFNTLVAEPHPHTAHQLVQTLHHLLPCSPNEVFLLAAKSIRESAMQARFQYELLAVGDVVKLIQRALADHREIFRSDVGQESECLKALLEVLDLFVEAGWAEARQLTHRLEEIYR